MDPTGTANLTRADRKGRFGIDVMNSLTWRGWSLGGDYGKKLVVKNCSGVIQKITYQLPKTKFFFMPYPEVISLSPGMSVTLDVSFRPIKYEEYHDFITIKTDSGPFVVKVHAYLPKMSMRLPVAADFGYCPNKEITTIGFQIQNDGNLPNTFRWVALPPFSITPQSGNVEPGQVRDFRLSFAPRSAASFKSTLVCQTELGMEYPMQVTAVSKFPFLTVDTAALDFGDVPTNARREKFIELTNRSEVRSFWEIARRERDVTPVFTIRPTSGNAEPGETVRLRVSYRPQATGTVSIDTYQISTPGGNSRVLTCRGTAVGPRVTADLANIDFGDVELGSSAKGSIVLRNESNAPAEFAVMTTRNSSFRFDRIAGRISGLLTTTLNVTFAPSTSVNYYQRVYIMIKNGAPMCFDLVGTCYDEGRRPMPLDQKHVDAYLKRCALGLRCAPDDEVRQAMVRWKDQQLDQLPVYNQFFAVNDDDDDEAVVSDKFINFGGAAASRAAGSRTITVTNRTKNKMICAWDVRTDGRRAFVVFPQEADIPAGRSAEFKVSFRPAYGGQYYASVLTCYCFPKSQRTFRLVDPDLFTPPLCLRTFVTGHTFTGGQLHFLPDQALSSPRLEFPSCPVGSSVYLTIALYNNSTTPMAFYFRDDSDGQSFRVKPRGGLIAKQSFQLLSFEFRPGAAKRYTHFFACTLNHSKKVQIPVVGLGERVAVQVGDALGRVDGAGNSIYFRPTARGLSSSVKVTLHNKSRVSANFEWLIPGNQAGTVSVSKQKGVLQGNERRVLDWTFTPRSLKTFHIGVRCLCRVINAAVTRETLLATAARRLEAAEAIAEGKAPRKESEDDEQLLNFTAEDIKRPETSIGPVRDQCSLSVKLRGISSTGAVKFGPTRLEMGRCPLNQPRRGYITLTNNAPCAVRFQLSVAELLPTPRFVPPKFFGFLSREGKARAKGVPAPRRARSYTVLIDTTARSDAKLWEAVRGAVGAIAGRAPGKGVTIVFCRGGGEGDDARYHHGVQSVERVSELFAQESAPEGKGGAAMAGAVEMIFEQFRSKRRQESLLMLCARSPRDREALQRCVVDITQRVSGSNQFTLSLVQLGSDASTAAWLETMDRELVHMGARSDIADTVSASIVEGVGLGRMLELCMQTSASGANPDNGTRRDGTVSARDEPRRMGTGMIDFLDCKDERGYLMKFDTPTGELPPRATRKMFFSFCTSVVARHCFRVKCDISVSDRDEISVMPDRLNCECLVTADGEYPQLRVRDAVMIGSERAESWAKLSLDALNRELAGPLTPLEQDLNARRKNSEFFRAMDVAGQLRQFDFDFGVGKRNKRSEIAYVELYNPGYFATEWTLLFPDDADMEPEKWASMQPASGDDLVRTAIVTKKVFTTSAKSGTLLPGQSTTVQVCYNHIFVGRHRLPLVLRVNNGKQVTLNLVGETLASFPTRLTMLDCATNKVLAPVPIGLTLPTDAVRDEALPEAPVQTYDLINKSINPLNYRVDTSNLDRLRAMSYGVDVFTVENPEGVVPPQGRALLRVRFRPVEARGYHVELPIRVSEAPAIVETVLFSGRGVDPTAGDSKAKPPVVITSAEEKEAKGSGPTLAAVRRSGAPLEKRIMAAEDLLAAGEPDRPRRESAERLNQAARLSLSTLTIGRVPCFSRQKSVVLLTNLTNAPLFFDWQELPVAGDSPDLLETVTVAASPRRGKIGARASVVVSVDLRTGNTPRVLRREIRCQVSSSKRALAAQADSLQKTIAEWRKGATVGKRVAIKGGAILMDPDDDENVGPETRELLSLYDNLHPRGHRPGEDYVEYDTTIQSYQLQVSADIQSTTAFRNARTDGDEVPALAPFRAEVAGNEGADAKGVDSKRGGAAGGAVEALLREAMQDPVYSRVMRGLRRERVPSFRELEAAAAGAASNDRPAAPAASLSRVVQLGPCDPDLGAADGMRENVLPEEQARNLVENIMANIASEAVYGEFDPTKRAKQVVTEGLEIERLPTRE